MNIFFFIFFILINYILIFKVTQYFKLKTVALAYIIGLGAAPLLMLAGALLLNVLITDGYLQFQDIYLAVLFTLIVVFFVNIVILFADAMLNKLLQFHETGNTLNIDSNPIRFAVRYKVNIIFFYKIGFFAGSTLLLYWIWLGPR